MRSKKGRLFQGFCQGILGENSMSVLKRNSEGIHMRIFGRVSGEIAEEIPGRSCTLKDFLCVWGAKNAKFAKVT